MSVIDKLKENVERLTGMPFVYGSSGDINTALDQTPLPCVFAYLLSGGSVNDENGMLHERVQLAVFFVNKTVFDFEGVENEQIIDDMKRRAFGWYTLNRNNDALNFGTIARSQRVYDRITDAIVTGYAIEVAIEERECVGACNAPEPLNLA